MHAARGCEGDCSSIPSPPPTAFAGCDPMSDYKKLVFCPAKVFIRYSELLWVVALTTNINNGIRSSTFRRISRRAFNSTLPTIVRPPRHGPPC